MSKDLEAALLFCCCIAKHYKLRGLKQHIFTVSRFMCLRVWAQLDWCLCSRFHKATHSRGVGWTAFSSGGPTGEESTRKLL